MDEKNPEICESEFLEKFDETPDLTGDKKNVVILFFLYVLQGDFNSMSRNS